MTYLHVKKKLSKIGILDEVKASDMKIYKHCPSGI